MAILTFEKPINISVGIGDKIYAISPGNTSVDNTDLAGIIVNIPIDKQIEIDDSGPKSVNENDFIMFQKPNQINVSNLNGYYAKVRLENISSDKAELFSVGSEVTLSSK